MQFPKQLTIRLPELQRSSLQEIQKREPAQEPTDLVESALAIGIRRKLAHYEDEIVSTHTRSGTTTASSVPPVVAIDIRPEDRLRMHRLLKDDRQATVREFVRAL